MRDSVPRQRLVACPAVPPVTELVTQVSEKTMARARELVAQGKVILAVKDDGYYGMG